MSDALPERTAAQPPIRPAPAARQKRSRRVLEDDDGDSTDQEVVWEDRPEPVVDLTTVEDDSSRDETALPSSPAPRSPPPSTELLHAVVALRQDATVAIANRCLDLVRTCISALQHPHRRTDESHLWFVC